MTAKGNATDLMHFISKQMRMAQVYQPVMIKTLLANGGAATTEEIAKALLAYDQSQVEYYSLRTKAMVGKVLTNNGVVEPIKDGRQITGYRLTEATHTDAQRAVLQACVTKPSPHT
jgi:NADH:flavin oxidoreductases, Old Yellow Enzyme family